MSSSTQPREEVFPGYVLAERIGSGGYAEVWRATAPGGIDKAVKIVYGCYDDQLASQEMKAMERIKDVRHPFVLSLERFEVVDGRLAILTELADMSLEQRAQQCRAEGLPGIPRDELLRYIADAAEALDYLAQRHSLQHLDIKPANLLILGEHVKVADFGLVKELVSRTQNSIVAGLTPTYSSPEMFDDAPSPHSDQYSLAIVYQEMLTGVLPFPGRTAAQLANQHLRAQPQLAALDPYDRIVVARALAKHPAERFSSCRDFVKALSNSADSSADSAQDAGKSAEQRPTHGRGAAKSPGTMMPRGREVGSPPQPAVPDVTATQPTESPPHAAIDTKSDRPLDASPRLKEEIVDVSVPEIAAAVSTAQSTLYIAVGGIGIRVMMQLRDLLARRETAQSPAVEMIAIDTDRAELKNAGATNWRQPLSPSDALCLSLRLPQEYREQERHDLEWLSHRWLYNIPRSLETRGYRALGRLALVDHFDKAQALIERKIAQLADGNGKTGDQQEPTELRIVLLAGMGGGTGGGMIIDLANLARSRLQSLGRRGVVECVLVCGCVGNAHASPLSVANTYALLTELQFTSVFGNQGVQAESRSLQQLESRYRPFDLVYCIATKHDRKEATDGLAMIARQLSLAATMGIDRVLQACRQTATAGETAGHEPLLLRTFGSAPFARPMQERLGRLTKFLARAIEKQWLGNACVSEWRRLDRPSAVEDSQGSLAHDGPALSDHVPAMPSGPPSEDWRGRFGDHGSTLFAFEVVSRICCQSRIRDAYRAEMLSSTNPPQLVEFAKQALFSMSLRSADPPPAESLSDEDRGLVDKLAGSSHRVLTKLVDEIEQMSPDTRLDDATIERIVKAECVAIIHECLAHGTPGGAIDSGPSVQAQVQQWLHSADVDMLQCGYDRRTLVVVPAVDATAETRMAIDAVKHERPAAAVVTAEVDEPIIVCEGSGVSPSSFARGLERVYPGIAEAARRHYTRIDIDWSGWSL